MRELGVLVRPHPQNAAGWAAFEPPDERVAIWPRAGASPTDEAKRADYFDTLHHAEGVFGINTSALVEASVLRRPSFTLVTDAFRGRQEGTLHFAHLAGAGGPLVTARSFEEHHDQLAAALAEPTLHAERIERFLEHFVRPHGLATPAAHPRGARRGGGRGAAVGAGPARPAHAARAPRVRAPLAGLEAARTAAAAAPPLGGVRMRS